MIIQRSMCRLLSTGGLALVIFTLLPLVSEAQTTVTLRDGETYQVETAGGLPVQFANEQIKVQDLAITARFMPGMPEVSPYVRVLIAELLVEGQFAVTITSPLDTSATTTLAASGPGGIELSFFPQAEFPGIWEGIDSPGIHWFPFHFVFEDKQSGNRFEFTQWAQIDDQTWKQTQEMVEEAMQMMLQR